MTSVSKLSLNVLGRISRQSISIRDRELPQFKSLFDRIISELTEEKSANTTTTSTIASHQVDHSLFSIADDPQIELAHQWLRDMVQYNVPYGKLIRGLSLTINYQILANGYEAISAGKSPASEPVTSARILGWCVEMFQAYFLVLDDMMDNSITRRGQPCWYRNANVGLIACNDATLIESGIFHLMHRYLKDHPCYAQLVHLMHEGFRITGYGQCLDVLTESQSKQSSECNGKVTNGEVAKQTTNGHQHGCNLSVYKIDRYLSIVKYKTSFYTFVLSTRLALYLANRTDPAEHRLVESIMLKIGELFQVQDDYIDCYGDPELTGKIGTDIRDGKCSWLVVKALEHANAEQRAILQSNYAQHSDECELRVKSLYKQLNMTEVYHTYETETLNTILSQINQLKETSKVPVEIFYEPLSHVYNREK